MAHEPLVRAVKAIERHIDCSKFESIEAYYGYVNISNVNLFDNSLDLQT